MYSVEWIWGFTKSLVSFLYLTQKTAFLFLSQTMGDGREKKHRLNWLTCIVSCKRSMRLKIYSCSFSSIFPFMKTFFCVPRSLLFTLHVAIATQIPLRSLIFISSVSSRTLMDNKISTSTKRNTFNCLLFPGGSAEKKTESKLFTLMCAMVVG